MANAAVYTPPGVRLILDLTAEEAKELKAMVQNPVGQEESEAAKQVRCAIFNALYNYGV